MNPMQSPNTGPGGKDFGEREKNEEFEIFKAFNKMMAEDEKRWIPPRCHNTPMFQDWSDCETWWKCKHCGHTKLIERHPVY